MEFSKIYIGLRAIPVPLFGYPSLNTYHQNPNWNKFPKSRDKYGKKSRITARVKQVWTVKQSNSIKPCSRCAAEENDNEKHT